MLGLWLWAGYKFGWLEEARHATRVVQFARDYSVFRHAVSVDHAKALMAEHDPERQK